MEEPAQVAPEQAAAIETQSEPFVGRWNLLVSRTNWDKGRIILQWREALAAAGAPSSEYSDEAWSRRVGGVTGQHVGRLRRVYHRFGQTYEKYPGLYWSHFQAALDWDDAEMWLEGAVQTPWSVSQMRNKRFETVGGPPPRDEDLVTADIDEDYEPITPSGAPATMTGEYEGVAGPRHEGPDFGDEPDATAPQTEREPKEPSKSAADSDVELVQPFENLPELPDDLSEACDSFKLAILAHKAAGWQDVSPDDVIATLKALQALVLAPASDEAPF